MVVAACLDSRDAYDRVEQFVDPHEFTPMAAHWWGLVVDWYNSDPDSKHVDRSVVRERGKRQADAKHRETLLEYFDNLEPVGSELNVVRELIAVKRHAKGNELAAAVGGEVGKLKKLTAEYAELLDAETLEKDTWIEAGDWDDIEQNLSPEGRTKLLPLSLNQRCGGEQRQGITLLSSDQLRLASHSSRSIWLLDFSDRENEYLLSLTRTQLECGSSASSRIWQIRVPMECAKIELHLTEHRTKDLTISSLETWTPETLNR